MHPIVQIVMCISNKSQQSTQFPKIVQIFPTINSFSQKYPQFTQIVHF
jgi:hypothetical protein